MYTYIYIYIYTHLIVLGCSPTALLRRGGGCNVQACRALAPI